jgi:membrane-bound serine protease (ClpP class)
MFLVSIRRALTIVAIALVIVGASNIHARQTTGDVYLLSIDGVINPLSSQYLSRGLREATEAQASLVVVRLNTPGGLESTTREMVQSLLNSPTPVVVYVTPPGGRAASAGMFITIAGHVAAMAPGTNIGAAHPVGMGEQTDPVMAEKVTNDAAALARSIAVSRGRNAVWAEQAVRESVSITAHEALEQNVIDLVATDLDDLLRQLDGRQVMTTAGEVTLKTADAQTVQAPMTLPEQILHTIADPNIAYMLFTIGMVGLIAELYNPGTLFPGITGTISLLLGFVAFGTLPVNWAGVILLIVAIGLFVAELYTEGTGVLAVGGLIAFVLGSLMLYTPITPTSPAMPEVYVSPWLIVVMVVGIVGTFAIFIRAIAQTRRAPIVTGIHALIGRVGRSTSVLAPAGTVKLDGEVWSAVAVVGVVPAGEEVDVVGVEGVTLRVKKHVD